MKSVLLTGAFWLSAAERAVKTFAQTAVALVGANGVDLITAPAGGIALTAAGAAALSVLTSVGSITLGQNSGPSLADEQLVAGWDER